MNRVDSRSVAVSACAKIEEGIITRNEDQYLKKCDAGGSQQPKFFRTQYEKRKPKLNDEHHKNGKLLKARRELMEIPCRSRGKRLGFIMILKRGEISPHGIAAGELHHAGRKYQTEEQPAEKPVNELRRRE